MGGSEQRVTVSILAEIIAHKRTEVAAARRERSLGDLEARFPAAPARGFGSALSGEPGQPIRAIAEFKRASPSQGAIRAGAEPGAIAAQYAAAGASAISVLTDERYFDGHLDFVARASAAAALPILRKDFLIDPYQVVQARAALADAVLIIVASVDDVVLAELLSETSRVGLDALVEVHSEADAERAVAAGASIIGVNHRDLATFRIDMSLTGRLRSSVPDGCVLVAESGIESRDDVLRLSDAGADAILVGSSLMRADSPGDALRELLGAE